jgi:hypothetical protein
MHIKLVYVLFHRGVDVEDDIVTALRGVATLTHVSYTTKDDDADRLEIISELKTFCSQAWSDAAGHLNVLGRICYNESTISS